MPACKTKIVVCYSLSNAFDLTSGNTFRKYRSKHFEMKMGHPRLLVGEPMLLIHAQLTKAHGQLRRGNCQ